jgi:hypothetical protein
MKPTVVIFAKDSGRYVTHDCYGLYPEIEYARSTKTGYGECKNCYYYNDATLGLCNMCYWFCFYSLGYDRFVHKDLKRRIVPLALRNELKVIGIII